MRAVLCIGNDFSGEDEKELEVTQDELNLIQSFGLFNAFGMNLDYVGGFYNIDDKTVYITCNLSYVAEVA